MARRPYTPERAFPVWVASVAVAACQCVLQIGCGVTSQGSGETTVESPGPISGGGESFYAIFDYGKDPVRLDPPFMSVSPGRDLTQVKSLPDRACRRTWFVYSDRHTVGEFDLLTGRFAFAPGVTELCGLYLASTNPKLRRRPSATVPRTMVENLLKLHEQTMAGYVRAHEYYPVGPDGSEVRTHRCRMSRDETHFIKDPTGAAILAVVVSSGRQVPVEPDGATGLDAAHIYLLLSPADEWRFVSEKRYALLSDLDSDGTNELVTHHFGRSGGVFSVLEFGGGQLRALAEMETR